MKMVEEEEEGLDVYPLESQHVEKSHVRKIGLEKNSSLTLALLFCFLSFNLITQVPFPFLHLCFHYPTLLFGAKDGGERIMTSDSHTFGKVQGVLLDKAMVTQLLYSFLEAETLSMRNR